jgi:membrane protein DedA with SNARE-associated domain
MEFLSSLLTDLAPYMPLISFGLLLLAGINLPVSEDLVLLLSGALAATYTPGNLYLVYAGCYAGAFLSDLIAYCIGRFGGRRLLSLRPVRKLMSDDRITRMEGYFERYGGKTLLFGRLIPFGMRNLIFMTAGFSRMPIIKFMLIDLIPLTVTSSIIFYLGVRFGENYRAIIPWLDRFKAVIAAVAAVAILIFLLARYLKHRQARRDGGAGAS